MRRPETMLLYPAVTLVMIRSRDTFRRRFWAKVDTSGECWLWTGAKQKKGYGIVRLGPRGSIPLKAHRAALALEGIEVPEGHDVHHTCGIRACVRRLHLEIVEGREHKKWKWRDRARVGEQKDLGS